MKLTFTKKELLNIPNILCYIRLLCVPAFALAFWLTPRGLDAAAANIDAYSYMYVSLAIFAFASLTDVFDGKIARRFHMESAVGAALDPLADKLLQLTAVLCLCINGNVFWLFPALIGIRELYQIIMASVLVNRNIVGKANYWGKSAALCVAIGIICSTLGGTYAPLFKGGLQEAGVFGSWIISASSNPLAAVDGAQTAGMAFYWVAFCFLVVGTVLGYIAAGSYTYIVVKQIGKENFKTAKDIRLDYFHNDSEKVESKEELAAKEAETKEENRETAPEEKAEEAEPQDTQE